MENEILENEIDANEYLNLPSNIKRMFDCLNIDDLEGKSVGIILSDEETSLEVNFICTKIDTLK